MLELKGSDRPSPGTTKNDVACYSWLALKHPRQPQQKTGQVFILPSGAMARHGGPRDPLTLCGSGAYPVYCDEPIRRPFFCTRTLWPLTQLQDVHRSQWPPDEMSPEEKVPS